ncbi:MAG: 50S ribosomal protein L25 [Chloroflexota bacterium]|nr:50S ribosomal protein L25 [Chloroflexota bacterium]
MEQLELRAIPRSITGKKVKRLRKIGMTPGILYGSDITSAALKFNTREIEKVIAKAGSSSLIQVQVEGSEQTYMTIVRDVQRDVIKRFVTHVDLQALNMQETVTLPISILLVGEAPGVEELGGVLLQQIYEVEVECLPADLIPAIKVDITELIEIGDAIAIKDLDIPEKIHLFAEPDDIVVQITFVAEEELEEETVEETLLGEAAEVAIVGEEEEEAAAVEMEE